MPRQRTTATDIVVIQRHEVEPLLCALRSQRVYTSDWGAVSRFMLQTGMRTGEVFGLRWRDIAGDRALVRGNMTLTHGYRASTKTGVSRSVPLNAKALGVVERLTPGSDDEHLFPGGSAARKAYQEHFARVATRLHSDGVVRSRYRPYSLRHTAITRWIEDGVPVAQVARWAGNSTAVVFEHYCGVSEEVVMPVV
jgi:integrase